MKKIININLSGRVIPIEDSAYEKLQAYIESLRRYFANEEGRDEIINDIESRIAELLHDKIRKGASTITDADVEAVILSMGRPEDFDAEATPDTADTTQSYGQYQQQQQSYSETRTRRRLYRDTSDKFIGGVCSGIAAYLNVDPAIVRILFAIITFGGFGLGFLAYILLWIVLPPRDIESFSGKRLFRNPDDRVIGGVAGGLAAYFGKNPSTIRFIFAAPIVLSILISFLDGLRWGHGFDLFPNLVFGSLSGTFILAYVILWMVLPEAHSPYEKMEMRGEKVDVNTIRQNVKEGVDNMKERMKTWGEEVKDSAQNFGSKAKEFTNTRGKTFAREVGETARTTGRGLGHAIGVLFKVFFLFIAGTIAFGLFVAVIALIFGGIAWWPVNNFLWTSQWQQLYAWGTVIFFLGVPLIGFIIWVIRRILRVRSRGSYLGWTFGFLWTLGWISVILLTSSMVRDFSMDGSRDETIPVVQPSNNKMIVVVSQPELYYNGRFRWINDNDEEGWDLTNDTLKLSTIRFNVRVSPDSLYHVTMRRHSYGRTEEEAEERAARLQYSVISKDSVLDLANGYAIDKDSKFRGQQVEIEVMVPVGKKIRFDRSVNDKLNPTNIIVSRRSRSRGGLKVDVNDDYWRRFRSDVDYIMGIDGNLKEENGSPVIDSSRNTENYRYRENDSIRIQKEIERKKQELKELEEKKELQQRSGSIQLETMDGEEDGSVTGSAAPLLSLVNWF